MLRHFDKTQRDKMKLDQIVRPLPVFKTGATEPTSFHLKAKHKELSYLKAYLLY